MNALRRLHSRHGLEKQLFSLPLLPRLELVSFRLLIRNGISSGFIGTRPRLGLTLLFSLWSPMWTALTGRLAEIIPLFHRIMSNDDLAARLSLII